MEDLILTASRATLIIFALFVMSGVGLFLYQEGKRSLPSAVLTFVFFFPFYLLYKLYFDHSGAHHRWIVRLTSTGIIGLAGTLVLRTLLL